MQDYFISTENTSDISLSVFVDNFDVVKMAYVIDGKEYNGTTEPYIENEEFNMLLKKGTIPKTSLISLPTFIEFFTPILEKGMDILHIGFSSALSGTLKNALDAKKELEKKFPDRKIAIIDSLCASCGEAYLTMLALEQRKKGMPLDELVQYIENIKLNIIHYFIVDDLLHLHRNGRLSNAASLIGQAIKLKPLLHVDDNGKLEVNTKSIGKKPAMKLMLEKMLKNIDKEQTSFFIIGHTSAQKDAEWLKSKILEHYPDKKIHIWDTGPIIASHVGCGLVSLFFIGRKRTF